MTVPESGSLVEFFYAGSNLIHLLLSFIPDWEWHICCCASHWSLSDPSRCLAPFYLLTKNFLWRICAAVYHTRLNLILADIRCLALLLFLAEREPLPSLYSLYAMPHVVLFNEETSYAPEQRDYLINFRKAARLNSAIQRSPASKQQQMLLRHSDANECAFLPA